MIEIGLIEEVRVREKGLLRGSDVLRQSGSLCFPSSVISYLKGTISAIDLQHM